MKFKKRITYAVVALLLLCMPFAITAASAGSASNPLITLEYVNNVMIPNLEENIYNKVKDELYADIYAQVIEDVSQNLAQDVADQLGGDFNAYTAIYLTKGQKLQAKPGMDKSCEIILSAGEGVCYVLDEENIKSKVGLRDCTTGLEILNGDACPSRHYVIIPRGDGRGVQVTSSSGAYFLVRGEYEIVS